ncbi:MAG: hypothetical protein AMJ78_01280 [Omnitrophica WOR_2 bacterium SM23_29]|nr:MAG: hypothetical protein AMJ78_01280 [Omnitrophica WOR_2 bacterium SM23_29]
MRSRVILLLLFVGIIIVLLFSPLTSYLLKDLIISKLENALDMNIVLGKTQFRFPTKLTISDIKAADEYGTAFVAEKADFKLDVPKIFTACVVLDCEFQNVELKSKPSKSLNSTLKPLGVLPQDIYDFGSVRGTMTVKKGFFAINDLNAEGPYFKLSGDMARTDNKEVDYDIEFNINSEVVVLNQKYPLLIDEDKDGWYTIKYSVKGDPRNPDNLFLSTGGIKLQQRIPTREE